jgi:aminoglycoside phosphotransferase family enzyme
MTGMDMLLASLTPVQLAQFHVEDATEELIRALGEMEAAWQAWLIENLEKRTRE